jgi:hypothetical protein
MDPVKVIDSALELGFSLPEAIGRATGCSVAQLAASLGFSRSEASMCLNGYPSRILPAFRDAVAAKLSVDREVVDRWIERWAASRTAAERTH